jgi:hypothetical protein
MRATATKPSVTRRGEAHRARRDAQRRSAPAGERTPPDAGDREEEPGRDERVDEAEGKRRRRQRSSVLM